MCSKRWVLHASQTYFFFGHIACLIKTDFSYPFLILFQFFFLLTCNLFFCCRLGVLNVNSTGRLLFSSCPILVLFSCGYCSCLCCHIKYSILGISSQLLMDLCKQVIYICINSIFLEKNRFLMVFNSNKGNDQFVKIY